MRDWKDIAYLAVGNEKYARMYQILIELDIMNVLKTYDPILVGTVPIGIDVENSDLDIACEVYNTEEFIQRVSDKYGNCDGFLIYQGCGESGEWTIISFEAEGVCLEVFGQPLPVETQHGFRHMVVEDRILKIGGEAMRKKIINLKKRGIKTEPAFSLCLGLRGNPYHELLKLETLKDSQLARMIEQKSMIE